MCRCPDLRRLHPAAILLLYMLLIILSLTLLLVLPSAPLHAQEREPLGDNLPPGLRAYRFLWSKEPCMIYVAEMDRDASGLHVGMEVGAGQVAGVERVRDTAARLRKSGRRVWIATNGGFGVLWNVRKYGGVMESLHIQEGELVSRPTGISFGITRSDKYLLDEVGFEAALEVEGQTLPITGLNERPMKSCPVVLFTPRFGATTHGGRLVHEMLLRGVSLPLRPSYEATGTLHHRRESNSDIPQDGVLLSVWRSEQAAFKRLPEGTKAKLRVRLTPPVWNEVVEGIGGDERLLRAGHITDHLKDLERSHRHEPGKRGGSRIMSHEPRTALGFNEQKLFLVVADGRQPGYSTGLSLYDLAQVFLELGATEALNLDGGGSSTFVIDGQVANRPSQGKERAVLNAMMIWSTD